MSASSPASSGICIHRCPRTFPWEFPFHVGFFGALFKPEKSIFLFDPLLILTMPWWSLAWKRFRPRGEGLRHHRVCCCSPTSASTRATRFGAATLPGETVMSPPRRNWWPSSRCHFCCGIARIGKFVWIPALRWSSPARRFNLRHWRSGCRWRSTRWTRWAIRRSSCAALQEHRGLRLRQAAGVGPDNDSMKYDPWDYVHMATWNFLPFLLRRVGVAPRWAVNLAFAVWGAGLAGFGCVLARLRRALLSGEFAAKKL